jgi:CPA2 family monovalent cation:H+ antiporter-2
VVIVGLGLGGGLLARVVESAHIACVGIELSGEVAKRARREGHRVIYGDATRREVLEAAGVPEARVVVFAISEVQALVGCVHLAREMAPRAELIVRTHKARQVDALRHAGANDVVVEELEAGISMFTRVLEGYHVPRNVIRAQVRALRAEGYGMLRAPQPGRAVSEAVLDALAAGTTDLYRVDAKGAIVGRSLRSLDLRGRSGATVIAVVRGEDSIPNPSPDLALEAGDTLVLVASHAELDTAFALLDDVSQGVERDPASSGSSEGGGPVAEG